jgi:IclR family pca regulon transcriptional regulator
MAGRGEVPDFVEALARGLDVLACFDAGHRTMTLTEVATAADLARPTARRLLLTLAELGLVRSVGGAFTLAPPVLTLGLAYSGALGLWEAARPHLEALVGETGESSSISQLDGADIVYVARVSVPRLIAVRVEVGTRFPAVRTSQGKVLLAALSPADLAATLAEPSRAGLPAAPGPSAAELEDVLTEVRARGWALADEELAPGVRSVSVPVRDGTGAVRAAMNVTVHAAETPVDRLLAEHLPLLQRTAGEVSADWARWQRRADAARPHPGDGAAAG